MNITFQTNFTRFRNFFKRFKKVFDISRAQHNYSHENEFFENGRDGRDIFYNTIIFHPTSFGSGPYFEQATDSNLLVTKNEDVLRHHFFSLKSYFIAYCTDPFRRAFYENLQKEKNDKYYAYMKFYFSQQEVERRYKNKISRIECYDWDIPF